MFKLITKCLSFFHIVVMRNASYENLIQFPDRIHDSILKNSIGVLHIGGHLAEERFKYADLGLPVVWVEGIEEYHRRLVQLISSIPNQSAMCLFLSDTNSENVPFFLSNNDRSSSSLYQLNDTRDFPGLKMDDEIKVCTYRFDQVVDMEFFQKYNHVVIDVQGAELNVLKGFGDLLYSVKSLNIEISTYDIYLNGAKFLEIKSFLKDFGFYPLWEPNGRNHSDIIFMKSSKFFRLIEY